MTLCCAMSTPSTEMAEFSKCLLCMLRILHLKQSYSQETEDLSTTLKTQDQQATVPA